MGLAHIHVHSMARLNLLLLRLGLILLLYTVLRFLFFAFNYPAFGALDKLEIAQAFLVGPRYDISAILLINGPFIFFSLLPVPWWPRPWYQTSLKILFFVLNAPFLILNVVDAEYFKFIGERSNSSLFDMRADISAQLGQLTYHYWYLAIIGVLLLVVFYYCIPRLRSDVGPGRWATDILIIVAISPLLVLGIRGGWQGKIISTVEADVFEGMNLSHLALNSSFTLLHSRPWCDSRTLPQFDYFTEEELLKQFPPPRLASAANGVRRDNVVIIIVESLSAQYTGGGDPKRGFTPFLDELGATKGVLFKNHFADGRRSIDAPPAILAGLPHLVDETFYCAQQRHLVGIGSLLKERGYTTSFFHGGKNGTMYFDVFSNRMGFDRYYGLNEYPNPEDSDGIWGIYDEPFLQFVAGKLTSYKEPFASVVFTLSSHNPYKIPDKYAGRFPKGELPILESFGYVDYSLRKFFETAEKMPWYKNTLFIITGDHTAAPRTIYRRLIDAYRVPLIMFHPGGLPPVKTDRIVHHVDIGPSILDFLGIDPGKMLDFGHSVFDPAYSGLAYSQLNGEYWMAEKNSVLDYRTRAFSRLFDFRSLDPVEDAPEKQRLEKKLHAYIQRFNKGLFADRLYN